MSNTPTEPHLLLLGGTTEARVLAGELPDAFPGWRVTTSLAGRVDEPGEVTGEVRVGDFGGPQAMARWMAEHAVTAVVDATHPFAQQITANAAQACGGGLIDPIPLLRLERPAWEPQPGDDWRPVAGVREAAELADSLGDRLLVTTGRQEVAAFAQVQAWCLLRSIDQPAADQPLPARHELLLDRGPFTIEGERALITEQGIDVLVTKNSGGEVTAPKLAAAREAGIPVVVVERPPLPEGLEIATSVPEALLWLASVSAMRARRAAQTGESAPPAFAPGDGDDPAELLRDLGLPLSGEPEKVFEALRSGQGVDIDNAAGWPLPPLGPSASPAQSDAAARVLVTDMAPGVALQFSPGLPTLVISVPSIVVGVGVRAGTTAGELVAHIRVVLGDNLLAAESLVVLATLDTRVDHEAVAGASAELGVPVLGFAADVLAQVEVPSPSEAVAEAAETASVAEAAVLLAGARLVISEHVASPGAPGSGPDGGSTVAVGRLTPMTEAEDAL